MAKKIEGRFIIQIAGKPLINVEKALNFVLENLKKEKTKFKVIDSEIVEPELDEETTLYSGFIDVAIKFEEVKELLDFVFEYTPNSVVIEEPAEIEIEIASFNGVLNDISGHVLNLNSEIRNLRAQVHYLNKQISEAQDKGFVKSDDKILNDNKETEKNKTKQKK